MAPSPRQPYLASRSQSFPGTSPSDSGVSFPRNHHRLLPPLRLHEAHSNDTPSLLKFSKTWSRVTSSCLAPVVRSSSSVVLERPERHAVRAVTEHRGPLTGPVWV